jgi:hypothetical protein
LPRHRFKPIVAAFCRGEIPNALDLSYVDITGNANLLCVALVYPTQAEALSMVLRGLKGGVFAYVCVEAPQIKLPSQFIEAHNAQRLHLWKFQ